MLSGELPSEWLPVAGSQSSTNTIKPGYLVKLASGLITNLITPGSTWDTDTPGYGFADFNSVVTVNGVSTALAAGVLVKVIPFVHTMYIDIPTVTTLPAYATDLCSGANTVAFACLSSSGGLLQMNVGVTSKGVLRPFALVKSDWSVDGVTVKATGVIGDRYRCAIVAAAKQVII